MAILKRKKVEISSTDAAENAIANNSNNRFISKAIEMRVVIDRFKILLEFDIYVHPSNQLQLLYLRNRFRDIKDVRCEM